MICLDINLFLISKFQYFYNHTFTCNVFSDCLLGLLQIVFGFSFVKISDCSIDKCPQNLTHSLCRVFLSFFFLF